MSYAMFISLLDATVAIGLVCLVVGIGIDAFGAWRQNKDRKRRQLEDEADARRRVFKDLRGTRGRE